MLTNGHRFVDYVINEGGLNFAGSEQSWRSGEGCDCSVSAVQMGTSPGDFWPPRAGVVLLRPKRYIFLHIVNMMMTTMWQGWISAQDRHGTADHRLGDE